MTPLNVRTRVVPANCLSYQLFDMYVKLRHPTIKAYYQRIALSNDLLLLPPRNSAQRIAYNLVHFCPFLHLTSFLQSGAVA